MLVTPLPRNALRARDIAKGLQTNQISPTQATTSLKSMDILHGVAKVTKIYVSEQAIRIQNGKKTSR